MNKKIKILFNAFVDKDIFTAQDLNARDIALNLNKEKFESYLFLKKDIDNADKRLLRKKNIHLIKLPNIKFIRGVLILKNFFSNKYDFIISGKISIRNLLYLKFRKLTFDKKKQIHTVEIIRPSPFINKKYNNCAKYISLKSDYNYAISKRIQSTSRSWLCKDLDVLYAIGVDTNNFYFERKNFNNKKIVISCGSLCKRKQPDVFLKIAERNPKYDFIWVGEGEMQSYILEYANKNKISNFELYSNIPHPKLADMFRKSDIFLFPSIHEGFPKVIIEAMGCGLPVIAFDCYGPEAIINGKTGYAVKTESDMEEKMIELLKDRSKLAKMSSMAAERAKHFSWEKIASNYENIFNYIIIKENY